MNSKKKKKKKKVLYRKQINKILAIPGQMTAKEFADIVLLKPLPGSEVDKAYKYPELRFEMGPLLEEKLQREFVNEIDNQLFDL